MRTPGNQKFLRMAGISAILNIIRDRGPLSRTDIASETKLGWGTVTRRADELVKAGTLVESKTVSAGRGRSSVMLDLNTGAGHFIGVDFGSRKTSVVLADIKGEIVRDMTEETNSGGSQNSVSGLIELIQSVIGKDFAGKIAGIGAAVSGSVDFSTGEIIKAINFRRPLERVPLGKILQGEFKVPVRVLNALTARLLGEIRHGAGASVKNMVYLWLGTGVGSAIVSNGRPLIPAARERLGDIGHIMISPGGPLCKCGLKGCLEAYAGYERLKTGLESGDITLKTAAEHISAGLFYMIQLHAPEKIVIAGKYAEFGEGFIGMIRDSAGKKLPPERFDARNICPSETGGLGGARGAVEAVWSHLYGRGDNHDSN
jgi:predicted NBD/HSP70 family sugar kinase